MTELQRLTLVHEGHAQNGSGEYYRFAPGGPSKPQAGADGDEGQKAKSADAKNKGEAAKDVDNASNKKTVEAGGDRNRENNNNDDGESSPTSDGDNDTAAE